MTRLMPRLPLIALLLLGTASPPALAQQAAVTQRVDKLEREMRAVQRKVFPGGNQQYFEPEIAPAAPAGPGGVPATTPLDDLTGRVSTLEQELQRMTNQVEQQGFKLRQIEEQLNKMRGDTEYRLNTLEGGAPPAPAGSAAATPAPRPAPAATPAPKPAPATAAPAPAPATATATGDAGEDAYMAGYRLWEAKRYSEAITALKDVVAKYPKHRRASYAQNLVGRAYLDDGKPAAAAEAFYTNYQTMPRGERAPDSLVFLGDALIQLKKPAEACKVYDELQDVYGAKLSAPLRDRVTKARATAKCGA